jgi:ribosome-associated heat shock protein Hsp15
MESVRLDKWLWAMRIYKTRSDALEACRGSAVRLNGNPAKPAAKVRIGDVVVARTQSLRRTLKVLDLSEKRLSAARVAEFMEDQTPPEDLEVAREKRANARLFKHEGGGRPTKKDRRTIERLLGP